MAVNCCVAVGAMEGELGVTAMETSAFATVNVVLPDTPPDEAVMVVVPGPTAVASPEMLMVATVPVDESQFAVEVRFFVVPSL